MAIFQTTFFIILIFSYCTFHWCSSPSKSLTCTVQTGTKSDYIVIMKALCQFNILILWMLVCFIAGFFYAVTAILTSAQSNDIWNGSCAITLQDISIPTVSAPASSPVLYFHGTCQRNCLYSCHWPYQRNKGHYHVSFVNLWSQFFKEENW